MMRGGGVGHAVLHQGTPDSILAVRDRENPEERLKRLFRLRQQELLTEEEYAAKRASMLDLL